MKLPLELIYKIMFNSKAEDIQKWKDVGGYFTEVYNDSIFWKQKLNLDFPDFIPDEDMDYCEYYYSLYNNIYEVNVLLVTRSYSTKDKAVTVRVSPNDTYWKIFARIGRHLGINENDYVIITNHNNRSTRNDHVGLSLNQVTLYPCQNWQFKA